jgi:glycosyltransferase involved in cell wall biosynthesis
MQRQGIKATKLPLPLYYLKRIPFLLAARIGIKTAKVLVVPSEEVKKDVSEYYALRNKKITVTYEGLSKTLEKDLSYEREKQILTRYGLLNQRYFFYVGNAYPHKNLKIVIEAIKILNGESRLRLFFVLAGSRDAFVEKLNQMIENERVQGFTKVLGYVPDKDLGVLYKNSVAFVYPSLAEGFGLQGLEAMTSGSIVLASDIPVFKEIYGDFAFYFNPKDPNSIVSAMKYVLNLEEEKKKKLINKSQQFIKKYSWAKMAAKTLDVYRHVLYGN